MERCSTHRWMVQEHSGGRKSVTATVGDKLAAEIEQAVEQNPELTESRLVREGIRDRLQAINYEVDDV